MKQIILDPTCAKENNNLDSWKPDHPIPGNLRKWGYCPNFDEWLPGDLILFSAIKPSLIGKAIQRVQTYGGYASEDARWEHAAIYIGAGVLCEATRKGVKIGSIYDYVKNQDHIIRIRRSLLISKDKKDNGWQLAVNALMQLNYSYGYFSIAEILFKSINGFWAKQNNRSLGKRSTVCSQLYADAYVATFGTTLGNKKASEITPASLSIDTKNLNDVTTRWLKITN